MTTEEERDALFKALADAILAVLVKEPEMSFEEAAQQYRAVESDFVARAPDDVSFVLETRRRIAEKVLSAAHSYEQPFDACTEAWNELLRLGFTNHYREAVMTWFYADCCLLNERPEPGIAAIEPLLADFEGRLQQPNAKGASFYQEESKRLRKLLAELIAMRDAP